MEIKALIENMILEKLNEETKLTNDVFKKDMAAVKAGKADPSKMADKWGARGGAFLSFIKETKDDYTISHKTFSSAVQHAIEVVEQRGYEVDEDEWDEKVATGPRKPSKGKTNSYTIALLKDGKETKRNLQMQVYYDEGRYELNMYIS